ncbi:hypothetical protein LguiB_000311 [Lonicera macranthoides]
MATSLVHTTFCLHKAPTKVEKTQKTKYPYLLLAKIHNIRASHKHVPEVAYWAETPTP